MIRLKAYAADTGTVSYWRSYAKSMGRRWGYIQAAKHFAACHGSAVIHHCDDTATVIWREESIALLRVKARKHSMVQWVA